MRCAFWLCVILLFAIAGCQSHGYSETERNAVQRVHEQIADVVRRTYPKNRPARTAEEEGTLAANCYKELTAIDLNACPNRYRKVVQNLRDMFNVTADGLAPGLPADPARSREFGRARGAEEVAEMEFVLHSPQRHREDE